MPAYTAVGWNSGKLARLVGNITLLSWLQKSAGLIKDTFAVWSVESISWQRCQVCLRLQRVTDRLLSSIAWGVWEITSQSTALHLCSARSVKLTKLQLASNGTSSRYVLSRQRGATFMWGYLFLTELPWRGHGKETQRTYRENASLNISVIFK